MRLQQPFSSLALAIPRSRTLPNHPRLHQSVIASSSSSSSKTPVPATWSSSRPFSTSTTLTPAQTFSTTRILPYDAPDLFNIIADIAAYPSFIPYLHSSEITSLSAPDPQHKKQWPRTASLRVGYGPYTESFESRVYCAPYRVLEAVAGDAEPTIPDADLPHYQSAVSSPSSSSSSSSSARPPPQKSDLIASLLTRWTFRPFPFKPPPPDGSTPQEGEAERADSHPRTEVGLQIDVRFASAVYAALSQVAAPKVAGMVVEAFEKRAREVLGPGRGELEGGVEGGRKLEGRGEH